MMNLFGQSSQKLPIFSYKFGGKGPQVLILGGVHGDEPEGVYVALGLLQDFSEQFSYKLELTIVPVFNPDGVFTSERVNGNNVDLNRNLPTRNWSSKVASPRYNPGPGPGSESETQALVQWVKKNPPALVISLHSWKPMINTNGDCHPESEIMANTTGYKVSEHIGYPTPGSLGDYCGMERKIPTITYEVERGSSVKKCLSLHIPAIKKALYQTEKREIVSFENTQTPVHE